MEVEGLRLRAAAPSRRSKRPLQILPTATDTPYTSMTQPMAPAPKPDCCRMGARNVKVNAVYYRNTALSSGITAFLDFIAARMPP